MAFMIDNNGNRIPAKYVSNFDKERDKVSRRILARFQKARKTLETLSKESIADLNSLLKLKQKVGEKGNFATSSFDGLISCGIRQQYNILLDERVAQARELMLEYVRGCVDGTDESKKAVLMRIVEEAFRANKQGILPTTKIFSLMRMEVKDERWNEARQILQDAIKPQKGKSYLFCETRTSVQKDFVPIRLDLADCWPEEA